MLAFTRACRLTRPLPLAQAAHVNTARESTIIGTPAASTLGWVSWSLFEWARNPYVILVTIYIFAPYFSMHVVGDPVRGQALLGYASSIAGALIAVLAPILGAISDKAGRRKPWIIVFVAMMAPCIFLLWFSEPGSGGIGIWATLALIIVVGIGFEFGAVFHNAMLPHVAPARRIGYASGLALALGNLAAVFLMVAVLWGFSLPGEVDWWFIPEAPLFGLDQATHEHSRIVAPLAAVWLVVFALPMFLFTPDAVSAGHSIAGAVREGLKDVMRTLRALPHYRNVALYLVARMFFNDGMGGVLTFGGVYAAGTFDWETIEMLLFGIITSVSAAIGAMIGGRLDDVLGSRRTVLLAVGGTSLLLCVGVMITPDAIFFVPIDFGHVPAWDSPYFSTLPELLYFANTQLFAMFITVAFASARTMLARIAPTELMTQFFGLFALSGTATAFLGPLVVGWFTLHFESQRAGYASLLILLVGGFVMTLFVKEERATVARTP
jgi:UMF1 family MFS transporter